MRRSHVAYSLAVIGIAAWLVHNDYIRLPSFPENADDTPLSHLALKLEAEFRRDIHNNLYSLDYSAIPPNTILISVGYTSKMDRTLLSSIIHAAQENAQGVARDKFHIRNLTTETKVGRLTE